jgi:nucleotide-binding universal stress UspA family protein
MKRVLLCVDFSEVTDAVVEQGKIIARLAGAEVRVLHVAAPNPDFVGFEAGPDAVRRQVAKSLRDEHRSLEDLVERLRRANVAAAHLMVHGATVEAILEQADRFEADLIVLGSHGHSALFDLLAGSVTQGVLRKSPVPVLVVPARKEAASSD